LPSEITIFPRSELIPNIPGQIIADFGVPPALVCIGLSHKLPTLESAVMFMPGYIQPKAELILQRLQSKRCSLARIADVKCVFFEKVKFETLAGISFCS